MNWKSTIVAGVVGVTLFALWTVVAWVTVSGVFLSTCVFCAFFGAILAGVAVFQYDATGTQPPMTVLLPAIILGVLCPIMAILMGAAQNGGQPHADAGAKAAPGTHLTKDVGQEPALDDLLAGKAKDWKAGFKKAAGILTTPDGELVAITGRGFNLKTDGSGGATIHVTAPPANHFRTKLTIPRDHGFYIHTVGTHGRRLAVPGLQAGLIKVGPGGKKDLVLLPASGEIFAQKDPFCLVYEKHGGYGDQAELFLQLPAVTATISDPMHFTIIVRRSPYPLKEGEYMPGVPAVTILP